QFLNERTDEQKQLLCQAVKDKKIFVPLNEASLLTGFPALETLIHSLYPAFEFNQKNVEPRTTPTLRMFPLTHGRMRR
ncbi:MAG: hypothetical protein ACLP56_13940, partial [Candidatus Sulfotelmatobacter sp.]